MKDDFENVYDMIEHALEYAFQGKMQLKFYEFLKYRKTTKAEVDAFLQSSTAKELADEVIELQEYIKGGKDNLHRQLREAYGHISKPQARTEKPKTFQVKFGKLIALWNREIIFHLNFYLDIRKK